MNILLVDDHTLFAKSLQIALEDFEEIQTFCSTKEIEHLIERLQKEAYDLLLIDINLGQMIEENGLMLTKRILKQFPTQKIVIVSGYELPVYRKEARKIGARGFISKNVEPEELVRILTEIQGGTLYFTKETLVIEDLTEGEKRVLELVASGMKRKDIAKQLFLSERTISNHLQNIFEKLQVSSTIEAVTKAIQMGYIEPMC